MEIPLIGVIMITIGSIALYLTFGLLGTPLFWSIYRDYSDDSSPWRWVNIAFEKHIPRLFRLYMAVLWPLIWVVTILGWLFLSLPIWISGYFKHGFDGKPDNPISEEATPCEAPPTPHHSRTAQALGVTFGGLLLAKVFMGSRTRVKA